MTIGTLVLMFLGLLDINPVYSISLFSYLILIRGINFVNKKNYQLMDILHLSSRSSLEAFHSVFKDDFSLLIHLLAGFLSLGCIQNTID